MSIYKKTIRDAGLSPNAPTVGAKCMYIAATILNALEDEGPADTSVSATQSVLNRLVELGVDPDSTAFRAMRFDLNSTIEQQRQ